MKKIVNKWGLKLVFAISLLFITTSVNAASLKVGEKEFEDFLEAVDEANVSGNPVIFQNDYSYKEPGEMGIGGVIDIEKKVSVDLNGFTFTIGYIDNYAELNISNGILYAEGGLTNMLKNEENATFNMQNVQIKYTYNAIHMIVNKGSMSLENVTINSLENNVALISNEETGILKIKNSNIETKNEIMRNYGNVEIDGGTYLTKNEANGLAPISNIGNITVSSGTFTTGDKSEIFNVEDGATLIINNGEFQGGNVAEASCIISRNNCKKKVFITINDGKFTMAENIVSVDSLSNSAEITINGGQFTTTTTESIFSVFGGQATYNIFGGIIKAPNSTGIIQNYVGNTVYNIGLNDGTISQQPTIEIPNGELNIKNESILNYYDGIFHLKNKITKVDDLPDGYNVCYSKENGYIRAELKTSCDTTVIDNEEEDNSSLGEGEVENPQTGSTINWLLLSIFLAFAIALLWIIRKKNVFHKL